MFKIDHLVFVVLLAAMYGANAQTLEDLANSQRLKIRAELHQTPTVELTDKSTAVISSAKVQKRFRVHAIYQRKDKWIAEITDGKTLWIALPGMKLESKMVTKTDHKGLHIKSTGCKKCRPQLILLGDSL